MIGTIVNTGCIILGTLLGTIFKKGLSEKYTTALFNIMEDILPLQGKLFGDSK